MILFFLPSSCFFPLIPIVKLTLYFYIAYIYKNYFHFWSYGGLGKLNKPLANTKKFWMKYFKTAYLMHCWASKKVKEIHKDLERNESPNKKQLKQSWRKKKIYHSLVN